MAGALTISTLKNDTGVLATQNGMTGIAKAWVNFVGSTAAINGSFNVSSITRNSAGYFSVAFTTAMPSANYAVNGTSQPTTVGNVIGIFGGATFNSQTTPTTTSFTVNCYNPSGGGMVDSANINLAVFSA